MTTGLFTPTPSPWLVPTDGSFRLASRAPDPGDASPGKKANEAALAEAVDAIAKLQHTLYADDRFSLLLVFQAMDAAGKDGTIRAVMSGVNPQGCQTFAFKAPTSEELDHDFLWRVQRCLPERGRIGVFNRSHYEEVLVVRVNPSFLTGQRLPPGLDEPAALWPRRYASIREAERHWAESGTVIVKFFLHVSQAEQHSRFLARIDDPEDNWKFNAGDFAESEKWAAYQAAYDEALRATSTPWAPWYCVPADSKSFMRRQVAEIVHATLARLPLRYPEVREKDRAAMAEVRARLVAEQSARAK